MPDKQFSNQDKRDYDVTEKSFSKAREDALLATFKFRNLVRWGVVGISLLVLLCILAFVLYVTVAIEPHALKDMWPLFVFMSAISVALIITLGFIIRGLVSPDENDHKNGSALGAARSVASDIIPPGSGN